MVNKNKLESGSSRLDEGSAVNKSVGVNLASALLEVIYPSFCESCGSKIRHSILCEQCLGKVDLIGGPACPKCGAAISQAHKAGRCKSCAGKRMTFAACVALGKYKGILRDLVISLKFKKKRYIARFLGKLLAERLRSLAGTTDLIVPVPAVRSILDARRYNQAELLAKVVAEELKISMESKGLKKIRKTRPQVELSMEQRSTNPRGAYTIQSPKKFRKKVILLIDDVLTTGATASECTDVLKKAGASAVYLAVVARD